MLCRFKLGLLGVAFGLSLGQGTALAANAYDLTSASGVTTSVANTVTSTNASSIASRIATAVNSAVSGAVAPSTPNITPSTSSLTNDALNKQSVSLYENGSQNGFAAGNDNKGTYVWGSVSNAWVESDLASTAFKGDVRALNLGADKWFTDKFLAGVSFGYSMTDVDTAFNDGTYKENSLIVSPYAAYSFNDHMTISGLLGYYWSDIEQERGLTGTYAKSDFDADALFAATTLATNHKVLDFDLTGKVAYLWSNRDTSGYSESDSTVIAATTQSLSQGKIGGEAAYMFESQPVNITPFVGALYLRDFKDNINDDKDAIDTKIGIKISSKDSSVNGTIEAGKQIGRDDFNLTTLSATLRIKF